MYVLIQTYTYHNSNRKENNKKLKKKYLDLGVSGKQSLDWSSLMGGTYRQLLALIKILSHSFWGSEAEQLRAREHMVTARINNTSAHKLIKRVRVCCL